jgi:hypothetical protein
MSGGEEEAFGRYHLAAARSICFEQGLTDSGLNKVLGSSSDRAVARRRDEGSAYMACGRSDVGLLCPNLISTS